MRILRTWRRPDASASRLWFARLLLVATSTALAVIAGEALVRSTFGIFPENYDQLFAHDPRTGWKNQPGFQGFAGRLDARSYVAINSRGLRGRERDYRAEATVRRVLVIGDSFAFGMGVPEEGTFETALEASLGDDGIGDGQPRIEVINAGVIGYSTVQALLRLQIDGIKYNPDLVILLFYLDDLENNLRDRGLLSHDPSERANARRAVPPPLRSPLFAGPRELLRRHSGLYVSLGMVMRSALPGVTKQLKDHGLMARQERPVLVGSFHSRRSPDVEEGWRTTATAVRRITTLLRQHSTELLIAYVPLKQQMLSPRAAFDAFARAYDGVAPAASDADIDAPNRMLARIGTNEGVPVVDLTESFRAQGASENSLYYRYDDHWTAQGHRLAADVVSTFVRNNALLQTAAVDR